MRSSIFVKVLAAALLVIGIAGFEGTAKTPYYLILAAAWLLAWRMTSR